MQRRAAVFKLHCSLGLLLVILRSDGSNYLPAESFAFCGLRIPRKFFQNLHPQFSFGDSQVQISPLLPVQSRLGRPCLSQPPVGHNLIGSRPSSCFSTGRFSLPPTCRGGVSCTVHSHASLHVLDGAALPAVEDVQQAVVVEGWGLQLHLEGP